MTNYGPWSTPENTAKLNAAFAKLKSNSALNSFINSAAPTVWVTDFMGPYGSDFNGAGYVAPRLVSPRYSRPFSTYIGQWGHRWTPGDSVILVSRSMIVAADPVTFETIEVSTDQNGAPFFTTLDRMIFHEASHAVTERYGTFFEGYSHSGPVDSTDLARVSMTEQIAVNAENILYRSAFGGKIRATYVEHNSPTNAAVRAFDLATGTPTFEMLDIDGHKAARFSEQAGAFTVRKILFGNLAPVLGRSVELPGMPTQLLNYIINELSGSEIVDENGLADLAETVAVLDSASSNVENKIDAALEALEALSEEADRFRDTQGAPSHLRLLADSLPETNQTLLRGLSAEVFKGAYGIVAGPQGYIENIGMGPSQYIPIIAGGEGSVLVGAAGFVGGGANYSDRLDDLSGGSEGDILIAGDANPSQGDSLLYGDDGHDIIVSGTGRAIIDGGAGNDLIVLGSGASSVTGNQGNDTLAFANGSAGVTVDLYGDSAILRTIGTGQVTQGGATHTISGFELIMGTGEADTFKGGGSGVVMSGGGGADTFTLRRGDVAIGGEGADKFYIDTTVDNALADLLGLTPQEYLQSNYFTILDFDNSVDQLYINGKLFNGNQKSGVVREVWGGHHAGKDLYHNAINLVGESSYDVRYPTFNGGPSTVSYASTSVRDARIETGQGDFAGWDRLVFSAFDFEGGTDWEWQTDVDYTEFASIIMPTLGSGQIAFSSRGITDGQVRASGGLQDGPHLIPTTLTVNGLMLGMVLSETEVPAEHEFSDALGVGELSGGDTSGIAFETDDGAWLAEDALGGLEDVELPEVDPGDPLDPPSYDVNAPGRSDRVVVYRNGGSWGGVDLFANDGVSGSPVLGWFGNREVPGSGNLTLTTWFGSVSANSSGVATAILDDGEIAGLDLEEGMVLERISYAGSGIFSFLEIVLGGDLVEGTSGADNLSGTSGADFIDAGDDDDILDGLGGDDVLAGGLGDDHYVVAFGNGSDSVIDTGGTDLLELGAGFTTSNLLVGKSLDGSDYVLAVIGSSQRITLRGAALGGAAAIESVLFSSSAVWSALDLETMATSGTGAQIRFGDAEENLLASGHDDDLLLAGAGDDELAATHQDVFLAGELGDDVYFVTRSDTLVSERLGEGRDKVVTSLTAYSLTDHVDDLEFTSNANSTGAGNASDNSLTGAGGDDTLSGGAGHDRLDGGGGADALAGGTGNDLYVVGAGDTVTEGVDEGWDTVETGLSNYTLGANLETLVYTGTGAFTGIGNDLDNMLTGGADDDHLTGGDGNDRLNGGEGADTMVGGDGDDTYVVDASDDVVTEESASGLDTVLASVDHDLADHVENLTYVGTSDFSGTGNGLDNVMKGGIGDDVLDGGAGSDTMTGGQGDDLYVVDDALDEVIEGEDGGFDAIDTTLSAYTLGNHIEGLAYIGSSNFTGTGNALDNVLYGAAGDDILSGGAGSDWLNGGAGADVLAGGEGDDSYFADGDDDIVEAADEGTDTIIRELFSGTASFTLVANVENFELWGYDYDEAVITGNALDNILMGGDGADILFGAGGSDILIGHSGDDTYIIDSLDDTIVEALDDEWSFDRVETSLNTYVLNAGVEELAFTGTGSFTGTGNSLDNAIFGGEGDDNLFGGAGSDYLEGGAGADTMSGGAGGDTYYVTDAADVVVELSGEGMDGVETELSAYTLSANVESLLYVGTGNFTGTGNALDNMIQGGEAENILTGAAGNDFLYGGSDDDVLNGGTGIDEMVGGLGDDTYHVDHESDWVSEQSGEGTDTILVSLNEYTVAEEVENVSFVGLGNFIAYGNGSDNLIVGGAGSDLLYGSAGTDILEGGAGDDTYSLYGSETVTIFDTSGTDSVQTGMHINDIDVTTSGNDYIVTDTSDGRQIIFKDAASNPDAFIENISFIGATKSWNTKILANPDRYFLAVTLSGTSGADTLTGGDGDDEGTGLGGADIMNGGGGDDRLFGNGDNDTINGGDGNDYLRGNIHNDTLSGGSGNDEIYGDQDNDLIIGGAGDDLLFDSQGSDTYRFGIGDGRDRINDESGTDVLELGAGIAPGDVTVGISASGRDYVLSFAGGTDRIVLVGAAQSPSQQIEQIIFSGGTIWTPATLATLSIGPVGQLITGTSGDDGLALSTQDGGRLYGLAGHDLLVGASGDDLLSGGDGDDDLRGHAGDDLLEGGAGHDHLNGGLGRDTMTGGTGDDHYYVDDVADVVVENAGEGYDTVHTTRYLVLGENIEALVAGEGASGMGNALDNLMTTTSIASVTLYGAGGNDEIHGGAGDDELYGGDGDDQIWGGAGEDYLRGEAGSDTLAGGRDDDTYVINEAADTIIEAADEGYDSVYSSIDLALPDHVEALTLVGTAAEGIGNERNNYIEAMYDVASTLSGLAGHDELVGSLVDDLLDGGSGHDRLRGNDGNDELIGGDGDDVLNGGAGADVLTGGNGNDVYEVDDGGDVVTEGVNGGHDIVYSSIDLTLADNVERLYLEGEADEGVGNASANYLYANAGAASDLQGLGGNDFLYGAGDDDRLTGGAGNDALDGGSGLDTAVFSGDRASYTIVVSGGRVRVIDNDSLAGGDDGTDTLSGIETLEFADGQVAVTDLDNLAPVADQPFDPLLSNEDAIIDIALPAGSFVDPEGAPLTVTAALVGGDPLPTWLSFDGMRFTGTPPANFNGSLFLTLTASDGELSTSAGLELRIVGVNDAPVAAAFADVNSAEDQPVNVLLPVDLFSDVDGDTLSLSATLQGGSPLPTWLQFDGERFTGTPPADFNGAVGLVVTASDGSTTVSRAFDLIIDPVNDAPQLQAAIADAIWSVNVAQQLTLASGTFADIDGDALTLSASLSDGSALPAWLSFNAATRTFSGTGPAAAGLSVKVTASDGHLSVSDVFILAVSGAYANRIDGTGSNNTLTGTSAADEIYGLGGNDVLSGLNGNDLLDGGLGDDRLIGGAGADTLVGGDGHDWADYSTNGAALVLDLYDGSRTTGHAVGDSYIGIESYVGTGFADTFYAGATATTFDGGSSNFATADTVDYSLSAAGITLTLAVDSSGLLIGTGAGGLAAGDVLYSIERVVGTTHNDVYSITGSSSYSHQIAFIEAANGGIDEVRTDRSTYVLGSNLENLSYLGSGTFTGTGNVLDNVITGGAGNDLLTGGAGADRLVGGDGFDWANYATSSVGLTIDLYDGSRSTGDAAGDTYAGMESYVGTNFADTFFAGATATTFDGGASSFANADTVDYSLSTAGIAVTLSVSSALVQGTGTGGLAAGDTFYSIERVVGTSFNDVYTITGNATYSNQVAFVEAANGGIDELRTDRSSYVLGANIEKLTYVGTGNFVGTGNSLGNVMTGGSGDDRLIGGAGADTLVGGDGHDWADYSTNGAALVLDLYDGSRTTGDAVGDTYSGIESFVGTGFADTFYAGATATTFDGGSSNFATADTVDYSLSGAGITLSLAVDSSGLLIGTGTGGLAAGDVLYSIERVVGSSHDDVYTITGNATYSSQIAFVEAASGGSDEVRTDRSSYSLGSNIEELTYIGTGNFTGTGNTLANILTGAGGNDRLTGGGGADTLAGDSGTDVAVFTGLQADYSIVTSGGTIQIVDNQATVDGDDGTDTLLGIEKAEFKGGVQVNLAAPIVIDLDGDGVELVDKAASSASFDWDGDGLADRTGWVGSGDGFLTLDRDGDGTVSGARELSFIDDKPMAKSDLDGLSAFDSDGDGRLSAGDDRWSDFHIWKDVNGNGNVDASEYLSMADAGITSIGLSGNATAGSWGWNANIVVNTGSITHTDGTAGQLADVALNYDRMVPAPSWTPEEQGSGQSGWATRVARQLGWPGLLRQAFDERPGGLWQARRAFDAELWQDWSGDSSVERLPGERTAASFDDMAKLFRSTTLEPPSGGVAPGKLRSTTLEPPSEGVALGKLRSTTFAGQLIEASAAFGIASSGEIDLVNREQMSRWGDLPLTFDHRL